MRGLLAAGLVAALGACSARPGDDLAACKAAEARMATDSKEGPRVVKACLRAHHTTGSSDALIIATLAQLTNGEWDAVVAAAAVATGEAAPRLWNLAGEAELARGRHGEARRWYERSLEAQRTRDPRRAANTAARIANLESARGALDEAIRFQHTGRELAAAGGDSTLSALMALDLAQLALDVGDVRAAGATLAGMTDEVRQSSSFYREYLATAGELDALAGRPATAHASFELCVRDATATDGAGTQRRCHLGLATLALAERRHADARAALELAASYDAGADREFGPDPDRAAELAWLRARLELRDALPGDAARADQAIAALQELAELPLGAGMRSRVSFTIGRALVRRGRAGEAEPWFTAAAEAVELLRDGAHYREIRRSLPRELRAPYEALFALRVAAGDPDGALVATERALTRDFVDQLAASVIGDVPAGTGGTDPISTAERRARALRTLDARPVIDLDPATVPWPIVGFFAAEGTLWRTRIADGKVTVEEVAALSTLAPMVKAVRADPAAAAARDLRGFLLPDHVLPPPDQPLVIVPDPFLAGVRFAALIADGHFIIERNPVVLAPTFTMAAGLGAAPGGPPGPAVVLGVVDATLPAVAQEVAQVGGFLGVAPRLGPAADRAALFAARRARVLHVASHGSARNDETFLVLGDGDLGTADVLDQRVAPELVVVASCLSAAARPEAMWTSIAAAFLANGSRMVIGATGSIPDRDARAIVVEMHGHARHVAPPLALARALRAAINRGTPLPSWSAFAVLGSPGG